MFKEGTVDIGVVALFRMSVHKLSSVRMYHLGSLLKCRFWASTLSHLTQRDCSVIHIYNQYHNCVGDCKDKKKWVYNVWPALTHKK